MRAAHPKAGQVVKIKTGSLLGKEYWIEDYWQNVSGESWMDSRGNPAALTYAVRAAKDRIPPDNEVLYGKIGAYGHLVHVSEVE